MISLHFTTRLPGFTLEAECDLPGDGFTAVLGPSGCGKSTLAGGIAGLVKPASGTISVNGRVFRSDDPCIDLPVESRGIGFVFQSHRLFPHLTVRENLLFGRRFGGRRTAVDQDRLIEVLGIAHLLSRRPDTLSGGESQRVALGRAILAAETLLIMDEPLASLDSERKAEL
ncbi:MAG: ATP-binding cassette domain-containing protein, partial [Sutterella wadsworthensis]|nr:ATP-binding cassette domain-containing protein [Sutterella wadsworthensis]